MRLAKMVAATSLLLASVAAVAAVDHEADLRQMLGKRVAGPPVDCIDINEITGSHIVDGTAILYDVAGGDIYVNRPKFGASLLSRGEILVTDTHTPQLCSVDQVGLVDNATHIRTGTVGLGEFVPYHRVH